jgi:serine/threonine protein phosphatase PrpC
MLKVSAAASTHPGLRRDGNEDAYCLRPDLGLYVVADGMGGHSAGEVASRIAADTIEEAIQSTVGADPTSTWPVPYQINLSLEGNRLHMALVLANRRVGAAIAANDAYRGMATTASAVLVTGDQAVVAHIGDSRVYRSRGGVLEQITSDHSWVGEQVRAGIMTVADARRHPWRNVVTRAVTGGDDPQVDVTPLTLQAGDRLLVCSDGLSSVASHEDITAIMGRDAAPAAICEALIACANDAGGPDNITVIVLDVNVA